MFILLNGEGGLEQVSEFEGHVNESSFPVKSCKSGLTNFLKQTGKEGFLYSQTEETGALVMTEENHPRQDSLSLVGVFYFSRQIPPQGRR